jgi:hypothetical protein
MESDKELSLKDISEAINTLLDNPSIKRLDGDGWKAYRVADQIRVDISNPKQGGQ